MSDTLKAELRQIENLATAGRHADALRRLDELASDYASEGRIWASRAYVNGHGGNRVAAIADWSRAISLCDKEPHYLYMRGIDFFGIGKYREAVADFTKVIELCDYHKSDYYREPAYFFRADSYLRLGEFERAKSDCLHISEEMQVWTDILKCKADILAECS